MANIIKTTRTFEITFDYDITKAVDEGFSTSRTISIPLGEVQDESVVAINWTNFATDIYSDESTIENFAEFKDAWRNLFQPTNWLDNTESGMDEGTVIPVEKVSGAFTSKRVIEYEDTY